MLNLRMYVLTKLLSLIGNEAVSENNGSDEPIKVSSVLNLAISYTAQVFFIYQVILWILSHHKKLIPVNTEQAQDAIKFIDWFLICFQTVSLSLIYIQFFYYVFLHYKI